MLINVLTLVRCMQGWQIKVSVLIFLFRLNELCYSFHCIVNCVWKSVCLFKSSCPDGNGRGHKGRRTSEEGFHAWALSQFDWCVSGVGGQRRVCTVVQKQPDYWKVITRHCIMKRPVGRKSKTQVG